MHDNLSVTNRKRLTMQEQSKSNIGSAEFLKSQEQYQGAKNMKQKRKKKKETTNLKSFFEFASVLGSCNQGTHVQGEELAFEGFRHIAVVNTSG